MTCENALSVRWSSSTTSTVNPRSGSDNVIRFSSVHPMLHLHWHGRWAQARALDRFAQKSSPSVGASTRFATIPSTLLLRRASRCWLFDEIALIRIDVADLRRTDDLPLGVTRRDLVPLGNVARLDPLACQSIAVAE